MDLYTIRHTIYIVQQKERVDMGNSVISISLEGACENEDLTDLSQPFRRKEKVASSWILTHSAVGTTVRLASLNPDLTLKNITLCRWTLEGVLFASVHELVTFH